MDNPCHECLVKPMCRKGCDIFAEYITEDDFFQSYMKGQSSLFQSDDWILIAKMLKGYKNYRWREGSFIEGLRLDLLDKGVIDG